MRKFSNFLQMKSEKLKLFEWESFIKLEKFLILFTRKFVTQIRTIFYFVNKINSKIVLLYSWKFLLIMFEMKNFSL